MLFSGSINVYELGKIFAFMGQGATQEQLEKIIDVCDEDGSGEIEFEEFLAVKSIQIPTQFISGDEQLLLPTQKD